jgi:hypothetical protein
MLSMKYHKYTIHGDPACNPSPYNAIDDLHFTSRGGSIGNVVINLHNLYVARVKVLMDLYHLCGLICWTMTKMTMAAIYATVGEKDHCGDYLIGGVGGEQYQLRCT